MVAAAARSGVLRVDDELHLSPLPAEDEDPEVTKLLRLWITASVRFNCRK